MTYKQYESYNTYSENFADGISRQDAYGSLKTSTISRFASNATVRRLELLTTKDRLIVLVRELPYSLIWVNACADLASCDRQLAHWQEAA